MITPAVFTNNLARGITPMFAPQPVRKKSGKKSSSSKMSKKKKASFKAEKEAGSASATGTDATEQAAREAEKKISDGNVLSQGVRGCAGGIPLEGLSAKELQRAVLWAEILGEPAARKRRRKRVSQYGNQGNADRR